MNDKIDVIGITFNAEGTTTYAAIWQGKTVTSLNTLPRDVNSLGESINNFQSCSSCRKQPGSREYRVTHSRSRKEISLEMHNSLPKLRRQPAP
jgi:hypothetical protein